jgi:hypothetical protein
MSQNLRKLNLLAGWVHVVLFVAFAIATYITLASQENGIPGIFTSSYKLDIQPVPIEPGEKQLGNREFTYGAVKVVEDQPGLLPSLALSFVAVTSIFHFFVYRGEQYFANTEANRNPHRWLEYAITSTLMLLIICFTFGRRETYALALLATVNVMVMLCGYAAESPDIGWRATVVGWLGFVVIWTILFDALYSNVVAWQKATRQLQSDSQEYRDVKTLQTFVVSISIVMFLLFSCFGIVQVVHHQKLKTTENKGRLGLKIEKVYIILSLVAKTTLVGSLFYGWYGRTNTPEI